MLLFLDSLNRFLWGVPVLIMILALGLRLSIKTGFVQIRKLPHALREMFHGMTRRNTEGISSYRALCTALAATVGTGNLAGVAGAITIGGPGAVFWMWICGVIGMMIKFEEVILAVRYRRKNSDGAWIGGPMYMIESGMPARLRLLAGIYCFLGVAASFGIGNTVQVNTVVDSIGRVLQLRQITPTAGGNLLIGAVMAAVVASAFTKGSERIGSFAQFLVPTAAGLYILLSLGVVILNVHRVVPALTSIVTGAFSPRAVTGGAVGSVFLTVRIGTSRGVFTNEAGMGTASIAHAESNASTAFSQGLMGIAEVFLDTIVICTLTALAILCSGVSIPYGAETGIQLTLDAFTAVYGEWVILPLTVAICFLATATVLGWGLYAIRCAQYLFGERAWGFFAVLQPAAVLVGAIMNTSQVWVLSELLNCLMAIPNLIALTYLMPTFLKEVNAYRSG